MSNWTDENRLRLIKAYKKRPVLWCRSDPDHSVLEKRKEALADLTKYMNKFEKLEIFNEEDIKTQLKNLKDMYRRKVKKMQQMKLIAHKVEEPCWSYFEHLKFLDVNYERPDIPDDEASNQSAPELISQIRPSMSPTLPLCKSEVTADGFDDNLSQFSAPSAKRPRLLPADNCHDDSLIFGQLVGTTLQKLCATSPALAIKAKKKISDYLWEVQLEACQLESDSSTNSKK